MNTEVTLVTYGEGGEKRAVRRALLANNSKATTISKELAAELGIRLAAAVPVSCLVMKNMNYTLHLPSKLMYIELAIHPNARSYAVTPLIHENAWFDIIIGTDYHHLFDVLNNLMANRATTPLLGDTPSPGSRYAPDQVFVSHNVTFGQETCDELNYQSGCLNARYAILFTCIKSPPSL
jgi:hypothetical protein